MSTSVPPWMDGVTDISAWNGPTSMWVCANSITPTTTLPTLTRTTAAPIRTRPAQRLCSTRPAAGPTERVTFRRNALNGSITLINFGRHRRRRRRAG
jgi:hypothetical protein